MNHLFAIFLITLNPSHTDVVSMTAVNQSPTGEVDIYSTESECEAAIPSSTKFISLGKDQMFSCGEVKRGQK